MSAKDRLKRIVSFIIFVWYIPNVAWNLYVLGHSDPSQLLNTGEVVKALILPWPFSNPQVPRWVDIFVVALIILVLLWLSNKLSPFLRLLQNIGELLVIHISWKWVSGVLAGTFSITLIILLLVSLISHFTQHNQGNTANAAGNSTAKPKITPTHQIPLGTILYQNPAYGHDVAWSPDGKSIASIGGFYDNDMQIQVWEPSPGKLKLEIDKTNPHHYSLNVSSLSWSSDSRFLAFINGTLLTWSTPFAPDTIEIWDTINKVKKQVFVSSEFTKLLEIAWSPNNKYIALLGEKTMVDNTEYNTKTATIQILNVSSGTVVANYPASEATSFSWSHDGRQIVVSSNGILNLDTGQFTSIELPYYFDCSWSPTNKLIAAVSDNYVAIVDAQSGKIIRKLPFTGQYGYSTAWSPDNKYIAASVDNNVFVWDASTGKMKIKYTQQSEFANPYVGSVTWSPDSKYIASGGSDGVQIWEAE